MPAKASMTERSAMRLFVVARSLTQKSQRLSSPVRGLTHSTTPPAAPGLSPSRPLPRHDSSAKTATISSGAAIDFRSAIHDLEAVDLVDVEREPVAGGRLHGLDGLAPRAQAE